MIGLSDVVKEKVNQSKYDRIVGCGERKLISQNMIGLSDVVKRKLISQNMIGLSDVVKEKVNQSKVKMIGLSDVVKEKVNQSKYDRIVGCGERES